MSSLLLLARTGVWRGRVLNFFHLNWGRGFFRLWLLGALIFWIGIAHRMSLPYSPGALVSGYIPEIEAGAFRDQTLLQLAWCGVWLPGLVLAIGQGLRWLMAGFRT